jgi:hypothetical protein
MVVSLSMLNSAVNITGEGAYKMVIMGFFAMQSWVPDGVEVQGGSYGENKLVYEFSHTIEQSVHRG